MQPFDSLLLTSPVAFVFNALIRGSVSFVTQLHAIQHVRSGAETSFPNLDMRLLVDKRQDKAIECYRSCLRRI